MQNKDLHDFRGGLNADDNPANLPPGDYVDGLNIRTGGSDQQHGEGPAETLQSEISVLINPDSAITYYGNAIGSSFVYPGYLEVQIGTQIWMKKNWDAKYPGSKVYNDDENNRDVYGGLYTHGQILASDFCPDGWHVPTEAEVDILIAELLGEVVAGGKMKDIGWWDAPNTGADDSSGFKAMPGGGFGMDVMYYGTAIGSDNVYDLLGSTGLLWLADEVPDVIGGVIKDIDGNIYTSVIIGTQEWLVENLKTTHYADGALIPLITDDTDWTNDVIGAMCYYNNDKATYEIPYGALYNWYATDNASKLAQGQFTQGGVSSIGWRIPTRTDLQILSTNAGGDAVAGGALKEVGITHWNTPNTGAIDSFGFKALGASFRGSGTGFFDVIKSWTFLWSSTPSINGLAAYIRLMNNGTDNFEEWTYGKKSGHSVRCMRDI